LAPILFWSQMSYFTEELELEGVTFYVRGLTVKEFTELAMDKKSKTKISFNYSYFYKVAMRTIVGWDNMFSPDEAGDTDYSKPVPFSPELIQQLPDHILLAIGNHVYSNLTIVSDLEESKLRGYVRFAFFMSDKPDSFRESYSCVRCLKEKKNVSRKCGLTEDEKEFLSSVGQEEEGDDEGRDVKDQAPQIVAPKKQVKRLTKAATRSVVEPEIESKRLTINMGGFNFPECPVSWVEDHLRTIGEQLFFCHQNKVSYFSGGVSDQLYKIYSMVKIVGGETSAIENERMKESTGSNSHSSKRK